MAWHSFHFAGTAIGSCLAHPTNAGASACYLTAMRTVLISLFLSWVAVAAGQAATLSPSDLLPLLGSWKGELMCIDYSSGAETHIPATLRVDALGSRSWLIGFGYTDEPHANEQDTV